MGWNSWDCFATTVTEAQTRAQADYMARHLASYGWQYIVVDIQWYEPGANSYNYRRNAKLTMDEWGRLLPATNRFPSSVNGVGFKALADHVHQLGLKFGVHLLRGIPRQAVVQNTPIKGTTYHAADIADKQSICRWNGDMYGVDMTRPGAQEYYDSVFDLFASWDVDFVKVDDISRPYHKAEIEGIRKAIDQSGRPMVLSLSPGETPLAEGEHVSEHANMWRISDDFWDRWPLLFEQFERCRKWAEFCGPGHFPDADMLPLGVVSLGRRTRLTRDEQFTLMSLWSICRSPLIFGGDMTKMDDFTLSLLTNKEVLAVDQSSSGGRQLFNRDGLIAWTADVPNSKDKYVALFNTRNAVSNEAGMKVSLPLKEAGFEGKCRVRDLWQQKDLGEFENEFAPEINWHGAGLYRVSGQRSTVEQSSNVPDVPETCYVFSYFTGNGEDGLHLAWSRDGFKWQALNHGKSYLTPTVGESKLMRDPCLLRGPDGVFRMVWTTSWSGNTLGYASSKDLIHWSEQRAVPVMADHPGTLNCWAPEITYDPQKSDYVIYWASTVKGRFPETLGQAENQYNHRIYSTTTGDFQNFSPARLFFNPGYNVIDATLLPANGRWHLIFKDETRNPPKKHLLIAVGDSPEGPFGDISPPFTRDWVEGPTAIKIGDEYVVYFDAYTSHRYEAMQSRDLKHWEDVTSKISFPRGARHGTVIAVPGAIVEGLCRAD